MQKFDDDDELLNDLMNIVQNDEHQQIKETNQLQTAPPASTCEATAQINENETINFDEDEFDDDEFADEIDEMLEKPIDFLDEKEQVNFYTYDKIQIKNIYWRGVQDMILPEGWVQVTHSCGMPLYLNRTTRVCTLSRPYYISDQSARKHDIPISAIPCMAYRKRKEAVEKQIREHNQAKQANVNLAKCPFTNKPNDQISSNSENIKQENISSALSEKNVASNEQSPADPLVKSNKKVVVSIQTNEEKSKENMISKFRAI